VVLQINGKDKIKKEGGKSKAVRGVWGDGRGRGVTLLIGQVDVFILDGYRIDRILEWFEHWNGIKGIKLRL